MTRWHALLLVGLAPLLATRAGAQQQLFRLAPNGSEVGMESRSERWWYDGRRPSQFTMFGEWFSLSANGMLIFPGVFAWSGTVRPYFGQQDGTGTANAFDSRKLGLSLGGNLFAALPVSLAFNAHRSSGHLRAGVGGENEFFTSGGGGILAWRNGWFPVTLDVSSRATEDSWTSVRSLAPIRRAEVLRDVRLQAQSSKTTLLIDRVGYRDRLGSLSFRSLDGTLEHALRWGTGSVLTTTLQSGRREGSFPHSRNAVGAQVFLRQTPRASTDFYAQRRGGTSSGIAVDNRTLGAAFRIQSREWLHNSMAAAWNGTTFRDGGTTNALYTWRSQVNRRLRGAATLNGALVASLERLGQSSSGSRFLDVVDERYTLEASRTFTLLNPRVDTSSVVLRNPDQTILFVPEIDYRLILVGASVRVQVLPGSRLAAGDVVVVSYRYEALRSGRHDVRGLAADVAIGTSELMIRASESIRDAEGSGNAQDARFLSGHDRTLGVTIRHGVPGGRLEFDAQRRSRRASANDFLTDEARIGFAPRGSGSWHSSLGLRGSTSSIADERLSMASADAALNWTASPKLRFLATGEHWLWLPSNSVTERFFAGTFEVNVAFGRIESSVRYMVQRRIARVDNNQHVMTARIVRRM